MKNILQLSKFRNCLHIVKGLSKIILPVTQHCRKAHNDSFISSQKVFLSQLIGGSVDLTKDDSTGIAMITINHAEKKNALSGKMMTDLHDIMNDLEAWKLGRGVLFHGANGTFCSGGDLSLMRALIEKENGGPNMSRFMQHTMTRLYDLPLVSLAFIEGRALGGGAELAVSCDLRVMTNQAQIGFVQCALGLSPGWGGGAKLVQLLGRTKALKLLAAAPVLSAKEALDIGLIDKVVASKDEAMQFLKTYTEQSRSSEVLNAAKRVVTNATSEVSFGEKLDRENTIFQGVFGGPAQIKAFDDNIRFSKLKTDK